MGEISLAEFYQSCVQSIDLDVSYDRFVELFCDIMKPNEKVVEMLEKLSEAAALGIISNTSEAHYSKIAELVPAVNKMTPRILSYEAQLLKPDSAIFSYALAQAKCRPAETLFIDDKIENINAAGALGLRTIVP